MPMTIAPDQRGDPPVCVLTLTGELDASNFEQLISMAQGAHDAGMKGLVLELSGLAFMASSGLVALYAAERIFRGEPPPDLEAGWQVFHDMGAESGQVTNVRLCGTGEADQCQMPTRQRKWLRDLRRASAGMSHVSVRLALRTAPRQISPRSLGHRLEFSRDAHGRRQAARAGDAD